MFLDSSFWVSVGFFIFIAIVFYKNVPTLVAGMLDERAEKIKSELDSAENLRREAQMLLSNYQKQQRGAKIEIEATLEKAKIMAKEQAQSIDESIEQTLEKRKVSVQLRVEQLRQELLEDISRRSTDIILTATHIILEDNEKTIDHATIIDDSIQTVNQKL